MKDILQTVLDKVTEARAAYGSLAHKKSGYSELEAIKSNAQKCYDLLAQAELLIKEKIGFVVEPIPLSQKENGIFGTSEIHESYGSASLSKVHGRVKLVGSMVDNLPSCVTLRISRAERNIDHKLHTENYFARDSIVEVNFSVYQWAELISSMNGISTPCTLRSVMGTWMSPVPDEARSPFEQIVHDSKEALNSDTSGQAFKESLDRLNEFVDTLKLSGVKEKDLKAKIAALYKDHVQAPINASEWASRRLAENLENSVSQSKIEIAAAFQNIINSHGLQALNEKLGLVEQVNILPEEKTKDSKEDIEKIHLIAESEPCTLGGKHDIVSESQTSVQSSIVKCAKCGKRGEEVCGVIMSWELCDSPNTVRTGKVTKIRPAPTLIIDDEES